MYTFQEFKESSHTAVIIRDGQIVFESDATGIEPLVQFLRKNPDPPPGCIVYDRYIGRAAALLMTLIRPYRVATPVISSGGEAVLSEAGIQFEAEKTVERLMGLASDDMCKWEKASLGKTAEEFWASLN